MKNLKMGFIALRDKRTESLKPMLLNVLARAVFFPDGENLLDKWNNTIMNSTVIKNSKEIAENEGSSFRWLCTSYGSEMFRICLKANLSISPNAEHLAEGVDQYRFTLPLPKKFSEGKTPVYNNAVVSVTEGSSSYFIANNSDHQIFTSLREGFIDVYVKHFFGVETSSTSNGQIVFSEERAISGIPYIEGEFSIVIEGAYM